MAWGCGAVVNTPHGDKVGAPPTGWECGGPPSTIERAGFCWRGRVIRQREARARILEVQSLLRPWRRAKPTHCERVPEGAEADVGILRPLLRAQ